MPMDLDRDKLISLLYETQYKKMYRVGYHMTGDKELAQDLVHDAFLLAVFRLDTFANHPKQEAWLMKTLTNLVQNEPWSKMSGGGCPRRTFYWTTRTPSPAPCRRRAWTRSFPLSSPQGIGIS